MVFFNSPLIVVVNSTNYVTIVRVILIKWVLQGLFSRHSAHQHPIIFLKDVSGDECEALLTYMYRGEVSVSHDQIHRILRVANSLQVSICVLKSCYIYSFLLS